MWFFQELTQEQDQSRVDADKGQAIMQQVHRHCQVEIRQCLGWPEDTENWGGMPIPIFQVLPNVSINVRNIRTTHRTRNLFRYAVRQLRVSQQVIPYSYQLELPVSIQIHLTQHVSVLDWLVEDPMAGQQIDTPPPVEVHEDKEYEASSVEDCSVSPEELQYLIQWTEYDCLT